MKGNEEIGILVDKTQDDAAKETTDGSKLHGFGGKIKTIFHQIKAVPRTAVMAVCGLGLVICIWLVIVLINKNRLNPSDYIKVVYSGADGYASAECVVDTEKVYKALAGREKNMDKLTAYRKLADSLKGSVTAKDISNGDKLEVQVTYDAQAAKAAGIVVTKNQYQVKAAGISAGENINLFEQVEVIFAGISPEAYVVINNHWADTYLNSLVFTADKPSGIKVGDSVTISCSADAAELARHGYVVSMTTAQFTADRLSSYVSAVDQIDQAVLLNIEKEAAGTVAAQTADMTFRMLYRATGNADYLYAFNDERADDIQLLKRVFLTRKNQNEGTIENYLYLIYRADIANSDTSMEAFFAFEYTQAFVTVEGKFDIGHDYPEKRYKCGVDYDSLYASVIGEKEALYQVYEME